MAAVRPGDLPLVGLGPQLSCYEFKPLACRNWLVTWGSVRSLCTLHPHPHKCSYYSFTTSVNISCTMCQA